MKQSQMKTLSAKRASILCSFLLLCIIYAYTNTTSSHQVVNNISSNNLRGTVGSFFQQGRERRKGKVLERKDYKIGLDFFIAGYPKTGTTSLMHYLDSSDEMQIVTRNKGDEKFNEFGFGQESDVDHLFRRIEEEYLGSDKDGVRYGIKGPGTLSGKGMGGHAVKLIEQYNPVGTETKILLGLRHPVRWFESFYNYRHGYEPGSPPTTDLIGTNRWKGVSTDRARFEIGILQLGNLALRPEDEEWIEGHQHYSVIDGGIPSKVFIYLVEQLGDKDKERKAVFLDELSSFLELKEPFTVDNDVPAYNTADRHHKVDICEPEHKTVRDVLVRNGKKTAEWIHANLAEAEGFVLPNKEHFLSIVDTFGTDPCDDEELFL